MILPALPKLSTASPWHGFLHLASRLMGRFCSSSSDPEFGQRKLSGRREVVSAQDGNSNQSRNLVSKTSLEREAGEEEERSLIPGLPDDVVLECVLAKLSWQDLDTVSSVSRSWRSVIQSRSVLEARIRTGFTQKLVTVLHKVRGLKSVSVSLPVVDDEDDEDRVYTARDFLNYTVDDEDEVPGAETFAYALSLHNPADNSWQQLPSITSVQCGIPLFSELACINGKLFVLGGRDQETWQPRREVYMLDLVSGNGRWQEMASMRTARASFGCGVIDDKLYAAGGHSDAACGLSNAEMYDVERNVWEPIADMHAARSCCTVAIWDKNMYVIGGYTMSMAEPGSLDERQALRADFMGDDSDMEEDGEWADSAEVWDSLKGEWRHLGNMKKFNDYDEQACTVFQGGLYSFSTLSVDKFDPATQVWTQMYKDSWCIPFGDGSTPCLVLSVAAVADEVFAMVCVGDECDRGCTLLRSKGFGKPGKRLCWERVDCPVKFVCAFPALCAVSV